MDVILPNRLLLIVDKGWLKGKPSGEAIPVGGQKKQHMRGQRSKVDNIAITVLEDPEKNAESRKPLTAPEGNHKLNENSKSVQSLRFVNATTPAHNRDPEVRRLVRSHVRRASTRVRKTRGRPATEPGSDTVESFNVQNRSDSDEKDVTVSPKFSASLPGSTTSLYGGPEFTIKPRFHELIDCCSVVMIHHYADLLMLV